LKRHGATAKAGAALACLASTTAFLNQRASTNEKNDFPNPVFRRCEAIAVDTFRNRPFVSVQLLWAFIFRQCTRACTSEHIEPVQLVHPRKMSSICISSEDHVHAKNSCRWDFPELLRENDIRCLTMSAI